MKKSKLQELKTFVESHGRDAFVNGNVVSFYSPWVNTQTADTGETLISVSTFKEAKTELGY